MKKIIMFLFSLIFLIGCGTSEQDKEIEIDNLQEIDGKIYEYGEEKPYSGKIIIKNENDKVVMIETAKNGKIEGEVETYYESGKLKEKVNDNKIARSAPVYALGKFNLITTNSGNDALYVLGRAGYNFAHESKEWDKNISGGLYVAAGLGTEFVKTIKG